MTTVRYIPGIVLLASLSLAPMGCALFKKNATTSPAPPAKTGDAPAPNFPNTKPSDPILGPNANANPTPPSRPYMDPNALLTGRIVDSYNRPQTNAYIRWVKVEDNKETGAPIDLAADASGYFVIQGLQPNAQYKVVARSKNGDRLMARTVFTSTPRNFPLVIQVSEDFVDANTPDLPASPAYTGNEKKTPDKISLSTPTPIPNRDWTPVHANTSAAVPANAEQKLPPLTVPTPPRNDPSFQDNIAADPSKTWPPAVKIPAIKTPDFPKITDTPPIATPAPPKTPAPKLPETSANFSNVRVPSCVRIGDQIQNFALPDINGKAWDMKSKRTGKLMLLDFWATYCPPCLQTIPKLVDLQGKYQSQGLEVIGIAYEASGSPAEQAHRISQRTKVMQVNYRQLLGQGSNCPVFQQLQITGLPTLILLDEQGKILWRHDGLLDTGKQDELVRLIKRQLRI